MVVDKRPTMREVAAIAGVSKAAVSVVLSGRESTTCISDETRSRVLEVADRLRYKPSMIARGLAERKSFLIGFICRWPFTFLAMEVVRGISSVIDEQDYSVLIYFHNDSSQEEAAYLKRAADRQVDALIVMPAWDPSSNANVELFHSLREHTPLVQILGELIPGISYVDSDHEMSGYMACRHLIELGHRRIIHFTYENYKDDVAPGSFADARGRWLGYERAMKEYELESAVFVSKCDVTFINDGVNACALAPDVPDVVEHPLKPTAVVGYCDRMALGLMNGFSRMGIRVPEQMSVTGFDNIEAASFSPCPLTTLQRPAFKIGQEAAKMILKLMNGRVVDNKMLAPEMIIRESTASPGRAERDDVGRQCGDFLDKERNDETH